MRHRNPSTGRLRIGRFTRRIGWWQVLVMGMVWLLASAAPAAAATPSGRAPAPVIAHPIGGHAQVATPGIGARSTATTTARPSLPCEDCGDPPPCDPTAEYCENFFIVCTPNISDSVSRGYDPEAAEYYSRIHWTAGWSCMTNYYAAHALISAQVALYDRSPNQDNESLGDAGSIYGTDNASSSGDIYLYDDDFPNTTQVELVLEGALQMTGVSPQNPWFVCDPIPPLRYVDPCEGLGTQLLTVKVGSNSFPTYIDQKVRGGCNIPDRDYYTLAEQNGYAYFSFWGTQRCTGTVQVTMSVGLYRASGGPALLTYHDQGTVTQANPLVVGKYIYSGNLVKVGDSVKIIISTTLVAPGAATWSSDNTVSHHCVGDGTDTLNCTDAYPAFKVPKAP